MGNTEEVICYRDTTFCTYSDCCKWTSCHRAFTSQVQQDAKAWWGNDDAPVAFFAEKPPCHLLEPKWLYNENEKIYLDLANDRQYRLLDEDEWKAYGSIGNRYIEKNGVAGDYYHNYSQMLRDPTKKELLELLFIIN